MATYDRRPVAVAFLDFSFLLPMEEHLRAEHIQDAILQCCEIQPEEGQVVIDEFAPSETNDALCVKGYVETEHSKHKHLMESIKEQFAHDGITEYLMQALQIESPVLKAENFTCRYASEGPEANEELLELDNTPNTMNNKRNKSQNARAPANYFNEKDSTQYSEVASGTSPFTRLAPLDTVIYPTDETQHADNEDTAGQEISVEVPNPFMEDDEFEDPNIPLDKKLQNFRKLLEQYMGDCESMYDQLLLECDSQIQQNY